jgi:hypothetical protein
MKEWLTFASAMSIASSALSSLILLFPEDLKLFWV